MPVEYTRKDGYCKDGAVSVYNWIKRRWNECSLGPEHADIKKSDKRRQEHFLSLRGERRRRASSRKQTAMG